MRDHALKIAEQLPTSAVNREYYLQNVDSQLEQAGDNGPGGALGLYLITHFTYISLCLIYTITFDPPPYYCSEVRIYKRKK